MLAGQKPQKLVDLKAEIRGAVAYLNFAYPDMNKAPKVVATVVRHFESLLEEEPSGQVEGFE